MNDSTPFQHMFARRWVFASVLVVGAGHIPELPYWLITIFAGGLLLQWFNARAEHLTLNRWLLLPITLVLVVILWIQFGTLLGQRVGIAMLTLMITLKLFEVKTRRDAFYVIFLSYFLLASNFLFNQNIGTALYVVIALGVITNALVLLNRPLLERDVHQSAWLTFRIMLQALPVMLVLFVFFPRISTPLWSLPSDAGSAVTGLSERLSPGSVTNLALSDEIAFRAIMENGEPIPRDQLYWRGPVFVATDGREWFIQHQKTGAPVITADMDTLKTTMLMEPTNQKWLVGLDQPVFVNQDAKFTVAGFWVSSQSMEQGLRYEVSSLPIQNSQALPPATERYLQLPDHVSQRVMDLAGKWNKESISDQDVVNQALQFFNQQEFIYTLLPPALGTDPVDEFLFESRRGFCEHYATSFVILMRAANIPARVVTGYMGGTWNGAGEFYTVRQSDAHAWSEVWINQQWMRVDPTSAVAPERIESSLDTSFRDADAPARFVISHDNIFVSFYRNSKQLAEAINTRWNDWVIAYSDKAQQSLLTALGFTNPSWKNLIIMLVAFSILVWFIILYRLLRRDYVEIDPLVKIYLQFVKRMKRAGYQKQASEGPRTFANRVACENPELKDMVNLVTDCYVTLRYTGQAVTEDELRKFSRLVKEHRRS